MLFIIAGCNSEKTRPIEMFSVPQLEFISDKSVGKDSIEKIKISIESFYISNEITNKEYREFTDWAKKNPDQILGKTKEIWMGKDMVTGKTKVYTVPIFSSMSELLPKLIDSNALYKLNKKYKNYFTDKKYDDYPVVGVSKNGAEYFCQWKTNFEIVYEKAGHGKSKVYLAKGPETQFRLPMEVEWNYVASQPLKSRDNNDHQIHKANSGSVNKWDIARLTDNVSEWVIPSNDTLAVSIGGSWRTNNNISDRQIVNPDSSNGFTGFRIVRTFESKKINSKTNK